MAVKNRDESITEVNSKIVPTLTNTTHKNLLNNDILNSVVFRKDVIASEAPATGTVTIDYINKDTATVVITGNLVVSFTNIENGDVKYLAITKQAGNVISFSGATDVSVRKTFINTDITIVVYEVKNKNGNIYVNSINIDNDISGGLLTKILTFSGWNMDTTTSFGVTHGVTDSKIRTAYASITGTVANIPLIRIFGGVPGGEISNLGLAGGLLLSRETAGLFDSAAFNNASGFVVIQYLP